jgi:hypothetical protein
MKSFTWVAILRPAVVIENDGVIAAPQFPDHPRLNGRLILFLALRFQREWAVPLGQ